MTPNQLQILQHSLGLDQYGQGRMYRNYFCSGDGCDPDPHCKALVELGFMGIYRKRAFCENCTDYYVTEAGKKAMIAESPAPPKLTPGQKRYREWLECADCFPDWTFGDYLKNRKKLQIER